MEPEWIQVIKRTQPSQYQLTQQPVSIRPINNVSIDTSTPYKPHPLMDEVQEAIKDARRSIVSDWNRHSRIETAIDALRMTGTSHSDPSHIYLPELLEHKRLRDKVIDDYKKKYGI